MRKRIGGNAQCPCRSGLKFKNCCGTTQPPKFPLRVDASHPVVAGLLTAVDRAKHQQGHSIRVRRVYSPTETFADFLINNVKWIVGESWYKAQLLLPEVQRHKILRWIKTHDDRARMYSEDDRFRHGDVYSVPATGDELSLLALGYDLLQLEYRGDLPASLVKRLKNHAEFQGALYEIAIAATFVRAGFEIKFIEEKSKKHPEFFATDLESGVRIGVESKSRRRSGVLHEAGEIDEAKALRGDVENLINEAFQQAPGDCPFLIFVDVNVPPVPGIPFNERTWFQDVWAAVQALQEATAENPADFNGLFLTTFHFHWEGTKPSTGAETFSVIPIHVRHAVPLGVWGRIVGAMETYGIIPTED